MTAAFEGSSALVTACLTTLELALVESHSLIFAEVTTSEAADVGITVARHEPATISAVSLLRPAWSYRCPKKPSTVTNNPNDRAVRTPNTWKAC